MPSPDSTAARLADVERMIHQVNALERLVALPTAALAELRAKAANFRRLATDPVRVAVAGGTNVGKSELIGALVNQPDLLPVSDFVTTGNVTALVLTQATEPFPAAPTATVEYLDEGALVEFRRALVADLASTVRTARWLPQVGGAPDPEWDWAPLARWCVAAYPLGTAALQLWIRQFIRLRDAAYLAEQWLGRAVDLSFEQVRESVLRLSTELAESTRITARPDAGQPRVPYTATPATAALIATFPLVRRIVVRLAVPAAVWPLERAGGSGLMLLDFPGDGAAESAARDRYLMRREFEELSGIVIVADAGAPQSHQPVVIDEMFTHTATDPSARLAAKLVVINRLNLVTDDVRVPTSTEPSEHDLRAAAPGVQHALEIARSIAGGDDRIALVSTWLHRVRIGCPREHAKYDPEALTAAGQRWSALATLMTARPALLAQGRSLAEAGRDGGVARLRELLAVQAGRAGIAQRQDRIVELYDEVRKRFEALRGEADAAVKRGEVDSDVARTEFRRALDNAIAKSLSGVLARARPAIMEASRPGSPARRAIAEYAARTVADWPHWSRLFSRVRDGGVREDSTGVPDSTDAFLDRFRTAAGDLARFADELADAALAGWARQQDLATQPAYEALRDHIRPAREQLIAEGHERRLTSLMRCTRFGWLLRPDHADAPRRPDGVDEPRRSDRADGPRRPDRATSWQAESPMPDPARTHADAHFPLARGKALPWHPAYPLARHGAWRAKALHQTRVMHMRRELVDALTRLGVAALDARLDADSTTVIRRLRQEQDGLLDDQHMWVDDLVDAVCGRAESQLTDLLNQMDIAVEPAEAKVGFWD